ncbi:Kazal-type serine protease inhibitor family protein [Algoriphagus aestuariicola]|uniref:Kazal-type serine protease inhibitor family protein n=1 Tax=Algoriphagus aestuariicola TaxID=1852016 RepID=A0ABS3BTB1_9BACT|nr:Kazal-type serine protease inhibitor domain-containing protein [Algoriphagus aestuariicola]MBN7802111.1 Kazal-type serine protease inhibitor family protein [Algoriphagus aestuariicola]
MKKPAFFLLFVLAWFSFGCGEENPPADCIDPEEAWTGPCTLEYVPVCGCNGSTYPNSCAADQAGLKSWTLGACK